MARKMFTDSDIWKKQRWFKKLLPMHKVAFFYIKDQCDIAGFWSIDCTDLMEDTGLKDFNITEFIKACNTDYDKITGQQKTKERIRIINNSHMWLTGFVQFQNGSAEGVDIKRGPVQSALEILRGFGLLDEAVSKGYLKFKPSTGVQEGSTPVQPPLNKVKVEVKDKVEDLNKKGAQKESDLIDAICEYFSVRKIVKSNIYNSVCSFVRTIGHRNELDMAAIALTKYMAYKARSQEQAHNIMSWIGTQDNLYQDGHWIMIDWEAKNKNHEQQQTQRQQPQKNILNERKAKFEQQ